MQSCALHHNPEIAEDDGSNPRQQLQQALVYESDGFKKTLVLQLNEFTATVNSDKGLVHIEDSSDVLRIYVPRNTKDRQQCYALHLPNALLRFLGLKNNDASLIFQLVFVYLENSLELLLDYNGIVHASVEDASEFQTLPSDDDDDDDVLGADEIEDTTAGSNTPPSSSASAPGIPRTFVTHHRTSSPSPRPFIPRSPQFSLDRDAEPVPPTPQYVQVLNNVIRLARQATLPHASQVPTNAPNGDGNMVTGHPFGIRSDGQIAHDIKIGAAGELYVCLSGPSNDIPS
jgi:hypothetical protein